MGSDAASAVSAVWRLESARLIAGLTRMTNDVGLAEDLAQDALVAALEQWPSEGIPKSPGAWLMAVAKRRVRAMRAMLAEFDTEERVQLADLMSRFVAAR